MVGKHHTPPVCSVQSLHLFLVLKKSTKSSKELAFIDNHADYKLNINLILKSSRELNIQCIKLPESSNKITSQSIDSRLQSVFDTKVTVTVAS